MLDSVPDLFHIRLAMTLPKPWGVVVWAPQAPLQSGECRGALGSSPHAQLTPWLDPARSSLPPSLPPGGTVPPARGTAAGRGERLGASSHNHPCRLHALGAVQGCAPSRPRLDNADGDREPTGLVALLRFHRSPAPPGRFSSRRGAGDSGVHRCAPLGARPRLWPHAHHPPRVRCRSPVRAPHGRSGAAASTRGQSPGAGARRTPQCPVPVPIPVQIPDLVPDPYPGPVSVPCPYPSARFRSRSRSRCPVPVLIPVPMPIQIPVPVPSP